MVNVFDVYRNDPAGSKPGQNDYHNPKVSTQGIIFMRSTNEHQFK